MRRTALFAFLIVCAAFPARSQDQPFPTARPEDVGLSSDRLHEAARLGDSRGTLQDMIRNATAWKGGGHEHCSHCVVEGGHRGC